MSCECDEDCQQKRSWRNSVWHSVQISLTIEVNEDPTMNTISISRRKFAQLLGVGAAAPLARPAFSSAKLSEPIGATAGLVRSISNNTPSLPSPQALKPITN